jgi:hypothetical protein
MEVRALEVGHGLQVLLPYMVLLILNSKKSDRQCATVVARQSSHTEVWVMCAIISMPVLGSLPTTDLGEGCAGSSGIVTLTMHLSYL